MRHDWLNLIEVSGPFLAVPVLEDVFPQGLEGLETARAQRLRRAHDEWREAVDADDPALADLHGAWIDEVLGTALEMDESVLRRGDAMPTRLRVALPEHGVTLAPDLALVDPSHDDAPLLLVHVLEPDANLDATRRYDGLAATPGEGMVMLLRGAGCPLGLVTNGERWMLVFAPVGSVASFASWYARLWGQERETLRAFVSLLGVRRFFGPGDERLHALYERSLKYQDDVTNALGEQVRRAVEVLVQAVDRADQDRNRELLRDTEPRELYEAALTVMMRLVFLLAAEERGLLLNDERYNASYAVSTLRMQLRAESEEILERRRSAWSRLLALFRAVYGGIEHPALRLPALGGSLFDPDRYPFLEGRAKGTSWRTHAAEPLPIDDRTVLLLLEAIQTFEARTLSYRALDVEQIGHVYEGLLERTVKRVEDVTLELEASAKAKDPRVTLGDLESAALDGRERIVKFLEELSQRSASAIRNALDRAPDERLGARLLTICRGDVALRDRIRPYAHLLRTDPWGYPLVHHADAFVVVLGADRRGTGTHYTPKSLTEKIVQETLTPLVYRGPAEGEPREAWELKRPDELLDLKVCDPAMGSGAFLVQACRFLSERLVEAWACEEAEGHAVDVEGRARAAGEAFEPLPSEVEERSIVAQRLVVERCLYGVDLNPLAVELAKLSLWLTTLAKGRPFGFLDHHLKSGDSLLGIHGLRQLTELRMKPEGARQLRLFGLSIERAVEEAVELRQLIASVPVRDIRDVDEMAGLDTEAREKLRVAEMLADAFIGTIFAGGSEREKESRLASLAAEADRVVRESATARFELERLALDDLTKDAPDGKPRKPFHWPLGFPEVFLREGAGFDAMVGNPPFLGGKRIAQVLGDSYNEYLKYSTADSKGAADICAYFYRGCFDLLRPGGAMGLLATNTIGQADTREVGLDFIVSAGGSIFAATTLVIWPGSANVHASIVHVTKGRWRGQRHLNDRLVTSISSYLTEDLGITPKPFTLKSVFPRASGGTGLLGIGFVISRELYEEWTNLDPRYREVLWPYINGKELNTITAVTPPRYVINFQDRNEKEAEQFPLAMARVRQLVKPQRDVLTKQIHEACYWKHWDKRAALYDSIRGLRRVLVCSFVSKHLPFTFLPTGWVYSKELVVIPTDDAADFAVLQSSIHAVWIRHFSGTLKSDLSYSISDGLRTFALPTDGGISCRDLGERYFRARQSLIETMEIGLTAVYNRFHDPADRNAPIQELRELHREIDIAAARAYGWSDLDLAHSFHEVPYLAGNDRVRFTISEPARVEVLRRLSELNRQRYEEEVARGLHGKTRSKGGTRKRGLRASTQQTKATGDQQAGFDFETSSAGSSHPVDGEPAQAILGYLRTHAGWYAKRDVLGTTGLTDGQWHTAIGDLVAQGHVERKGGKRGTRYRLKETGGQ